MNVVVLVGRLTKDPELRFTTNGTATCTFTIAVDDPFAKGEKKADFINCMVWRQQAEHCANFLRKGRLAAVEGRWATRHFDNNEGKRVYVNECVANNVRFLDRGNEPPKEPQIEEPMPLNISDDDLPF